MITIVIGEAERDIRDASEGWINQQINRRRVDRLPVCVRVIIKEDDLDLVLSTPTCGRGNGGSRPPRPREKKVLELWIERGLNNVDFTGGNLISFLKQLTRFVG